MAAVQAGKEIKCMCNLMHELGMKQLDLCYYWLRDAVQEQAMIPTFVPTTQQAADLLTKPLTTPKVREFCQILGLDGSGGVSDLQRCTIRAEY